MIGKKKNRKPEYPPLMPSAEEAENYSNTGENLIAAEKGKKKRKQILGKKRKQNIAYFERKNKKDFLSKSESQEKTLNFPLKEGSEKELGTFNCVKSLLEDETAEMDENYLGWKALLVHLESSYPKTLDSYYTYFKLKEELYITCIIKDGEIISMGSAINCAIEAKKKALQNYCLEHHRKLFFDFFFDNENAKQISASDLNSKSKLDKNGMNEASNKEEQQPSISPDPKLIDSEEKCSIDSHKTFDYEKSPKLAQNRPPVKSSDKEDYRYEITGLIHETGLVDLEKLKSDFDLLMSSDEFQGIPNNFNHLFEQQQNDEDTNQENSITDTVKIKAKPSDDISENFKPTQNDIVLSYTKPLSVLESNSRKFEEKQNHRNPKVSEIIDLTEDFADEKNEDNSSTPAEDAGIIEVDNYEVNEKNEFANRELIDNNQKNDNVENSFENKGKETNIELNLSELANTYKPGDLGENSNSNARCAEAGNSKLNFGSKNVKDISRIDAHSLVNGNIKSSMSATMQAPKILEDKAFKNPFAPKRNIKASLTLQELEDPVESLFSEALTSENQGEAGAVCKTKKYLKSLKKRTTKNKTNTALAKHLTEAESIQDSKNAVTANAYEITEGVNGETNNSFDDVQNLKNFKNLKNQNAENFDNFEKCGNNSPGSLVEVNLNSKSSESLNAINASNIALNGSNERNQSNKNNQSNGTNANADKTSIKDSFENSAKQKNTENKEKEISLIDKENSEINDKSNLSIKISLGEVVDTKLINNEKETKFSHTSVKGLKDTVIGKLRINDIKIAKYPFDLGEEEKISPVNLFQKYKQDNCGNAVETRLKKFKYKIIDERSKSGEVNYTGFLIHKEMERGQEIEVFREYRQALNRIHQLILSEIFNSKCYYYHIVDRILKKY